MNNRKLVTVFNVKGNEYRLIADIVYAAQLVNVLDLMNSCRVFQRPLEEQEILMRKTQVRSGARDSYFGLVKQLPLRTIKTDQQYNAGREFLVTTTMAHQNSLDQGVLEYIETLATLIENYEKENRHGPDLSSLTPVSAISHLMEVHKLTVTEMAKAMGTSQGTCRTSARASAAFRRR